MSRGYCLCRAAQNLLAYNSASERQFTVMPPPNSFSSNGHKGILTGGNKVPRTTSLISILTKHAAVSYQGLAVFRNAYFPTGQELLNLRLNCFHVLTDIAKRFITSAQGQVAQINVHGKSRTILKEKIDGRTSLQGKHFRLGGNSQHLQQ